MVKVKEKLGPSRLVQIRSQIDIMASILSEAANGVNKTRIMYRCNLSYSQLERYLKVLLGLDLLGLVSKKRSGKMICFKTSAKGCAFLDAYRKLTALMS